MRHATTYRARLLTDERRARRMADVLSELLDPGCAICSAIEERPGRWYLEVHFTFPLKESTLRELIAAQFGRPHARALKCAPLAPRDWQAESLVALGSIRAGRFVVHGAHDRNRLRANDIAIEIEAGMAFGTGHHGTTRGCLLALDRLAKTGRLPRNVRASFTAGRRNSHGKQSILDLGTGSGVLAIAAAKIFHAPVLATDHDARAVHIARANARANRVAPFVEVMHATGFNAARLRATRQFDLVLCNILLTPLQRMAAPMTLRVRRGGHAVLSGLLSAQANAAIAAYRAQSLVLAQRFTLDGWSTLVFRRPARKNTASMDRH
jgi:ribosomal protein L11 methyltransferase